MASTCRDGSVYKRSARRRGAVGSAPLGRASSASAWNSPDHQTDVRGPTSLTEKRPKATERESAACYATTLDATARSTCLLSIASKHATEPTGGRRPGRPHHCVSRRVVRARLWILPRRRRAAFTCCRPREAGVYPSTLQNTCYPGVSYGTSSPDTFCSSI